MMRGIFTTIQKNIEQESELSFYLCLYGGKWAPCEGLLFRGQRGAAPFCIFP